MNLYSNKISGFSLLAALFIIVVLGLLAAALFRMTQTANLAVAQEVLTIRAFFAAESGAQASAMSLFPIGGTGSCNNQTINFSINGLTGCRAIITCTNFIADGETFYRITSEGQCGSGELQASRTVEGLLKDL
ncbi:hypothetical protein [Pleionea sediminis]|uniref:hypothetical protein n=1 Tax=Pleionea sediminis TaxID=2569479 RepID=UPI0011855E55|nr:hypothetical protein [Pleionea sediminis]